MADLRSVDAARIMASLRRSITQAAEHMPAHEDYIARNCRAPAL
jgi:hypothetical protein